MTSDKRHRAGEKDQPGEGNREAARRYNERAREFVKSDEGKKAVEDHPVRSTNEGQEDERAERDGRKKAKETDPQVSRDYSKPAAE